MAWTETSEQTAAASLSCMHWVDATKAARGGSIMGVTGSRVPTINVKIMRSLQRPY